MGIRRARRRSGPRWSVGRRGGGTLPFVAVGVWCQDFSATSDEDERALTPSPFVRLFDSHQGPIPLLLLGLLFQ